MPLFPDIGQQERKSDKIGPDRIKVKMSSGDETPTFANSAEEVK